MMPGVTHFPVPSMTSASGGSVTVVPTAVTLPFCSTIDPRSIAGPAAVRIVALRMTVARAGAGWYVDAYGFCGACGSAAIAVAAIRTARKHARMTRGLYRGAIGETFYTDPMRFVPLLLLCAILAGCATPEAPAAAAIPAPPD